ncbi:MAG: 23S rRNA (pseudouridine(1915)-N(3))-methyltransferase RlmH [Paracoccaceae bacterium]
MTRVHLIAMGRQKSGPEASMVLDYLKRFDKVGRSLGLGPIALREIDDRKGGGMAAEAVLLRKAIPDNAVLCVLDERGQIETSPKFAARLGAWRDQGRGDIAFVIGGADGLDPALRAQADHVVSLGKMVWPHMLVRVMLAEQLYRAASIMAGTPYHRL